MVTASAQLSLRLSPAEQPCRQHSQILPSPELPSVLPTLTRCHPPTSITGAEVARQFPFLPFPSRGRSGRLSSTSRRALLSSSPYRKQPYIAGWAGAALTR